MASEPEELLAANLAFYTAFAERDVEAMDAVWSKAATIACIHPGWSGLHGRDAVMESWRSILTSGQSPDISCSSASTYLFGNSAFVLCTEHLTDGDLVATNIFVREDGEWRMIHHHAGPGPPGATDVPQDRLN